MTDTEKAALCARIDELCAENERLRQELDAVKCATCEAMLDCDECLRADASQKERKGLAYDKAKLREFAGQVLYFTTMTDGCGDNCPYSSSDCSRECHLREQGRELGIEVE